MQGYDDDGRFGFGEGEKIQLTFRIDRGAGQHLLESPMSADQQVTEMGDQLEFSATVVDSAMLTKWLRGFGDDVSHVRRKKT